MATAVTPELRTEVERVTRTLVPEYHGVFSKESIARSAEESAELLSRGATVQRFVPMLVERPSESRFGRSRGRRRPTG